MGIEDKAPAGFMLTSVEAIVGWARKSSVWPVTMGLACCAIEMTHLGSAIWSYTLRSTGTIL